MQAELFECDVTLTSLTSLTCHLCSLFIKLKFCQIVQSAESLLQGGIGF